MSKEIRDAANRIITTIVDRERTDIRLPPMMIAIVILAYVAVVIYYVLELYKTYNNIPLTQVFTIAALLTIGTGIVIAVFYILMSRNAKHAEREAELRGHLIEYAENNNVICGSDITSNIERLKEIDNEIRENEDTVFHKYKLLFIFLPTVIGVLILVAAYVNKVSDMRQIVMEIVAGCYAMSMLVAILISPKITVFPRDHEKRAIIFFNEFSEISACLNIDTPKFERTIGYRSFWLFLILSIVTIGAFFALWGYAMFNDLNEHFDEQWYYEDRLFKSVRNMETNIRDNNIERGKNYILEGGWT